MIKWQTLYLPIVQISKRKLETNGRKKAKDKDVFEEFMPVSSIMKKRAMNIKRNNVKMNELMEKYSNMNKNKHKQKSV